MFIQGMERGTDGLWTPKVYRFERGVLRRAIEMAEGE